jgi:hypothetical protein
MEESMQQNTPQSCKILIRNCGGVPVLDVIGSLNARAISTLEGIINTLASGGHFHIVLNLKRAAAVNASLLKKLSGAAQSIISHYGAIDVVAETAVAREAKALADIFRFCKSENEAFRRIKKLTRLPEPTEPSYGAQVMEAK